MYHQNAAVEDLIMWLLVLLACVVIWVGGTYWYLFGKRSPFSLESLRPPGPREFDPKKRDKVLKQSKMTNIKHSLIYLIFRQLWVKSKRTLTCETKCDVKTSFRRKQTLYCKHVNSESVLVPSKLTV